MAERKDAITIWAESKGMTLEQALKDLKGIDVGFDNLYVDGTFNQQSEDDSAAHQGLASAFSADQDLLRAFEAYRLLNKKPGVVKTLKSATNTFGVADFFRGLFDSVVGTDWQDSTDEAMLGAYGYQKIGDDYVPSWMSDQAQEDFSDEVKDLTGLSDEEAEDKRQKDEIADMRAEQDAMQQGRQGQNVFLDKDPQIGAVRQQVRAAADNPFLFGTEGNQSQIEDLLDKSSQKIPTPNRSDARSVANFNDAFAGREFVRDAAFRKQRELANLDRNRRNLVNGQGMQDTMMKWIAANPDHEMSEKGLANWTDQDKISFVRNFKLGNFDDPAPAPAPKGVPMFDKDGLMGFAPEKQHEADMGGQKFKVNMDQPNMLQKQERKNNAMLEDIRSKGNPFEKFGGSTDYAAEVASRKPVNMSNPVPQRDDRYKNPAYSQQKPLVNRDDIYKNPAYSQQTPISQVDQVRKDVNAEVNDILDRVPISVPPASRPSQRKQVSPTSRASGDSDARKTNITLDDFDLPTKIVNKLNLKPTYPFFGD